MFVRSSPLKRYTVIGILFHSIAFHFSYADEASTSDFDFAAALHESNSSVPDLHTGGRFPDGAIGFTSGAGSEGFSRFIEPSGTYKERREYKAHAFYCGSDAILLARFLDSEPSVLSPNKTDIYTASHFAVTRIIKGDPQMMLREAIVTYRPGGEIRDAGELLRVDTPNAPAYSPGRTYLLLLKNV